jgi:hypothetical protein
VRCGSSAPDFGTVTGRMLSPYHPLDKAVQDLGGRDAHGDGEQLGRSSRL